MAYDNKFKQQVLLYLSKGHSQRETSEVFGIGTATLKTWKKRLAVGTLFELKIRNRKPKKLDPDKLSAYVKSHPDAYLSEIAAEFDCVSSSVCKALKKLGLTRKKRHYVTASVTKNNEPNLEV